MSRILGKTSDSLLPVAIRGYRSCQPLRRVLGGGTRCKKPGMTIDSDHDVLPKQSNVLFRSEGIKVPYQSREMDRCYRYGHSPS